ncbi:MAG TPA: lactonase family protein [Candidatus Nanopelagicales bacterium]
MPEPITQDLAVPGLVVGTYTEPEQSTSEGVYSCSFDPASGRLGLRGVVADFPNPSFLAVHPTNGCVYTVNERGTFEGQPGGGLTALSVDPESGAMTVLGRTNSGGEDPCYVSIEASGRYLLVANYISGSVAMVPIRGDATLEAPSDVVAHSGSSVHPQRQDSPYAHSIVPDPSNTFAVACDLGTDTLTVYRMDLLAGKLVPHLEVTVPPGSGPRHLAFHPRRPMAYVVCELSSSVLAFAFDAAEGTLELVQEVSALPDGVEARASTAADIHVTPDGRYVYASNRGHDSLACFAVGGDGLLVARHWTDCGGATPRGFVIDPTGRYLVVANQDSNTLVAFHVDAATGELTITGDPLEVPMPVCPRFT